jgi:hypothetical protein
MATCFPIPLPPNLQVVAQLANEAFIPTNRA